MAIAHDAFGGDGAASAQSECRARGAIVLGDAPIELRAGLVEAGQIYVILLFEGLAGLLILLPVPVTSLSICEIGVSHESFKVVSLKELESTFKGAVCTEGVELRFFIAIQDVDMDLCIGAVDVFAAHKALLLSF